MDPLNPFTALDDAMWSAIEAAFGIRARIEPYTAPGAYGDGRPDLDRQSVEVIGVLSSAPTNDALAGQGNDRFAGGSRVGGQSVVFGLSAATVRALAPDLRPGDRVVLLGVLPPYPSRYRISRLAPTDMGDLELILNEANEG